jgi:hypothetical protein
MGKKLDETFRREQVQAAYSSVFGAVVERMLGHEDLSNRKSFLAELNFPTVVLFKDVTRASVDALLDRVGMRLKKELTKEFPETPIAQVKVRPDAGVEIEGAPESVRMRANELWNAKGESLAHLVV